jgi:uncharacterized membrane protein YfhO
MKRNSGIVFIAIIVFVFFWQFLIRGLIPIPSDTIVGLYHPFRDLYSYEYPNGIPFKNFLITDPVRQQYPWKNLTISQVKEVSLPLWNPYSFSGYPLMANVQSGAFYPLNALFFIFSFSFGWSLLIISGPLFGSLFMFLYLKNLKLNVWASILGAITFSFSGFFVAWMQWGNITHTALWLPLILLSIDKIFLHSKNISNIKHQILNRHIKNKKFLIWSFVFILSLVSAFFAGHLQVFFYLFIFTFVYLLSRWIQNHRDKKILSLFFMLYFAFIILTSIQWLPTLQFILLSARDIDVGSINNPGWFVPWQHLIQFVAPDYFGNPTTLNYWGVWNYGELVGYVGIFPLVLALFSIFFRHDKKTYFFTFFLTIAFLFSLPTFPAKIPFLLDLPFLSSSQPTRLIFIVNFSLAVLAAFGLDYLLKTKRQIKMLFSPIMLLILFFLLWILVPSEHVSVVKRNLILPTITFACCMILFLAYYIFGHKKKIAVGIVFFILMVTVFDLFRFGWKFLPFTDSSYLFPSTKTITFLQSNLGNHRFMSIDPRIMPPNFSTYYRLQDVSGYDPLYLLSYAELIAASERGKANINKPFGFNRIINPQNFESKIIDLLGVKYLLSLNELDSAKLTKVFQEGKTIVYENKNVLPRAFFVEKIIKANNKKEAIEIIFNESFDLTSSVVVENTQNTQGGAGSDVALPLRRKIGNADISSYSENKVVINTSNDEDGYLVLTDTYYPAWSATIDGIKTTIHKTNYSFRGIVVPKGKHVIEFYNSLF